MTADEIEHKILLGQFTTVPFPVSGSAIFWPDDVPPPDYNVYEEPHKRKIKIFTRKKVVNYG